MIQVVTESVANLTRRVVFKWPKKKNKHMERKIGGRGGTCEEQTLRRPRRKRGRMMSSVLCSCLPFIVYLTSVRFPTFRCLSVHPSICPPVHLTMYLFLPTSFNHMSSCIRGPFTCRTVRFPRCKYPFPTVPALCNTPWRPCGTKD